MIDAEETDRFLEGLLLAPDAVLDRIGPRTEKAGLPPIAVSPLQGAFLNILAAASGARRILEIGALGGYSTAWLARALPDDGLLVTLDIDARSVAAVQESAIDAGLGGRIRIIHGPAGASLDAMIAAVEPAFDFIFIDADKPGYPKYLEASVALSRPGTLIVADNVVREGEVANPQSTDQNALGVRDYLARAGTHPRLRTTALQTVGAKGRDGLSISIVR